MGLTKAAEQVEGEIRSHVGRRKVTALLRTRVWRYNSEERAIQVLPRPGLLMSFCVSWSQAQGRVGVCGLPAAGSYQQEEKPVCPALRSAAATAAVWLRLPHVSPAVLESPLQPLLSTACWSLLSGSPGLLLPSLLWDHLPAPPCLHLAPSPPHILPQALSELGSCRNTRFLRSHQRGFFKAGVPNLWDLMPDDLRWR